MLVSLLLELPLLRTVTNSRVVDGVVIGRCAHAQGIPVTSCHMSMLYKLSRERRSKHLLMSVLLESEI